MYAREAARLKFTLEEGMAVRCRGRLTLYEARGRFQMTVDEIEPTGAGALALAFEQLKQQLGAEGLFDAARKRPLPFLPRRLGVVTSPQGAVIRDIVRDRAPPLPVPILLAPTPVQGEGAALGIAAAIRRLEAIADVDVIIVARGGGSLEDLWAFNEEPVARAIYACRVPVISAVGHETDFTIADFVADVRAPTPSAAAERAVPIADDLRAELALLRGGAGARWPRRCARARHALERARGAPGRSAAPARRAPPAPGRARRAAPARPGRASWRPRAPISRAVEVRLHRAHPHRRIAEQRARAGGDAPPAGGGFARRRWSRAASRDRGGVRQAGGAVAAARARARLQPHPARRRPPRHQRRRRRARASASRVRVSDGGFDATVDATRATGDARKGPTIRAAVLGADVSKSRSPAIHNAAFRALGIDGAYGAISVEPQNFDALVADLRRAGYRYLNVTIPHKAAASALAGAHGPEARASGAVNTLLFEPAAASAARTPTAPACSPRSPTSACGAPARVVMAGAGGAAAGAVEALTRAGADVRLLARRRAPATSCARGCGRAQRDRVTATAWTGDGSGARARGRDRAGVGGAGGGLGDASTRAGLDALAGGSAVLEMAYGGETPLAVAARARGARYADGLGMLVHQAAHAIALALGKTPPLAPLFAAVRSSP